MYADIKKISGHVPGIIGEERCLKAAVCICLIDEADGHDVLFEVRSGNIPDQPGDVCFPGGRLEPGETYEEAAIRETCEELLVRPDQIKIIGAADIFHSVNLVIRPYAAILKNYDGIFNRDEVSEVFRVPLSFFVNTEPDRYMIDAFVKPREDFPYELIEGGRNYKWRSRKTEELFYQYNGHVIWGITARIINGFVESFSLKSEE